MAKKLFFSATDADTLAASDFVGSYLYGTFKLTSTTISAKEALDVNIANALNVNLDGIYDGVSNTDPDNTGIIGHTRASSPDDTGQIRRITVETAASDAVVAANVHGLDVNAFGMAYNGTTWDRLRSTSGALNVADGGGSLTVDGTVSISGTVTVTDAALSNTAIENGQTDIADTPTKVIGTDLPSRKEAFLYNMSNFFSYLGKQSGLAVTNGFPFAPGVYLQTRIGAAIALYGIAPSGKTSRIANLQFS